MKITPAIASVLFNNGTNASSLLTTLGGGVQQTATATREPISALKDAEKNGATYVAAKAKEPMVKRELEIFEKAVANAKTVEDFFKNPVAVKVFLTANGLGDQADFRALVSRTLNSDYLDNTSLAARMGATRGAWYETAMAYDFHYSGMDVLKKASSIAEIKEGYAQALWRESLEASAPGVSYALAFKERAEKLTSAYKVLGDPVAREVVTTALGLPPQIAYQPVTSQAALIERRIDVTRLKDPSYVDGLVKRYLVLRSGGAGGVIA
ncbi:MAG: DUF1217 domain-containing protein [Hyphomonadaceae bacterium]|nr:DUF1217 domain-containing protein [Hyphomonadaceae bacterium]